ncbi:hypothetical protein SDC9_133962 [bioreactor metagenome]|uniref:Uncharacterized protein n=1 Tax=bioreactor metagenome TaxID=1076179 RepID=A0A645DBM4_9ZZZZ
MLHLFWNCRYGHDDKFLDTVRFAFGSQIFTDATVCHFKIIKFPDIIHRFIGNFFRKNVCVAINDRSVFHKS